MEGQNITIGIAFVAGILSFLSPCVLPLVPGYISLMSGVSIDRLKEGGSGGNARRAVILNSLAFNAGLSVIFLALGTTAGLVGASIISNPWVRGIGGVIIILFGLQLIGLLKISTLYKDTRFFSNEKPRGPLGSFTLGIAFAAGWTPCIGPILGGIIGLAAASGGWRSGLILSAFYSAGLSIPFLATGLGINQFLAFYGKFRQHLHKVEIVSGVVLIVVGLLVMSGKSTLLTSSKLAAWMPNPESWIKVNPAPPVPASTPTTGQFALAPQVQFQTLSGQPFTLGQLRGNVVLLNLWATYCLPCRDEIPALNAMQHDLEARGLRIVGASLYDTAADIESYQKDVRKFEYQVLVGGDEAKANFDGSVLPTTYLIDREGRIRQKIVGARDREGWEAAVKPLLDEPQATALQTDIYTPTPEPPPREATMAQLIASTPDILRAEHCDIEENVSYTPEMGDRTPLKVSFDASRAHAPCAKIQKWNWDFGDGTSGSGKRVTHIYKKAGRYVARVNITDRKGYTNLVELEYVINAAGSNL